MSQLLQPEDDFLSHPAPTASNPDLASPSSPPLLLRVGSKATATTSPPPFTLSVKKGASVPGAELAARGVKNLFDPSSSILGDYRRALADILLRHRSALDKADEKFLLRGGAVAGDGGGLRAALEAEELAGTTGEEKGSCGGVGDEALEALGALGGQFQERGCSDPDPDNGILLSKSLLSRSSIPDLSQSQSQGPSHSSEGPLTSLSFPGEEDLAVVAEAFSTPKRADRARRFHATPILTQADIAEVEEAMEFGRSVDRGEGLFVSGQKGGCAVDDAIDPCTLTPFDHALVARDDDNYLYKEEQMGVAGFERSLSVLASSSMNL